MAAVITAKAGRHRQGEPVTRPTQSVASAAQSATRPAQSAASPPDRWDLRRVGEAPASEPTDAIVDGRVWGAGHA